jgi:hypothetical protein
LAIVNRASVNMGQQVPLQCEGFVSSGHMWKLHCGCTDLHCYQQCVLPVLHILASICFVFRQ